jgi:glycosyltransferase involved in cell wall biosynthesis
MGKNIVLSCIIITLNEEKYLSKLLDSLKKQTFQDFEIIVSDFDSKDKTRKIAREYGCKVVKGGKHALARNNGAAVARGEYFLFLDADSVLEDKSFLETNFNEFKRFGAGIASVYVKPLGGSYIDSIIFGIYNFWMTLSQKFYPHGTGACIFIKRKIFKKIGGFNEKIVFAEDHEILNRAKKYKFKILPIPVFVSLRRAINDGRFKTIVKYFYAFVYRTFYREIDSDLFNYHKYE